MGRRSPSPGAGKRRLLLLALALALAGCGGETGTEAPTAPAEPPAAAPDRLVARPGAGAADCALGEHELDGGAALMRVTSGGDARALLVVLHGAGGGPRDGLWAFRAAWEEPGLVLVAPSSAGNSWAPWGDVARIDRALAEAFERCAVDAGRIGIGGFSDGATYALSLGVANGDLFGAVIALSPGGVRSESVVGAPRVFVAHGARDDVIPIDRGGDAVVQALRDFDYSVTYRRFPGGHEVPPEISAAAVRWFLAAESES